MQKYGLWVATVDTVVRLKLICDDVFFRISSPSFSKNLRSVDVLPGVLITLDLAMFTW